MRQGAGVSAKRQGQASSGNAVYGGRDRLRLRDGPECHRPCRGAHPSVPNRMEHMSGLQLCDCGATRLPTCRLSRPGEAGGGRDNLRHNAERRGRTRRPGETVKEPSCKNHPDRLGKAHYKEYSLCMECLNRTLEGYQREPLDEHGRRMESADDNARKERD